MSYKKEFPYFDFDIPHVEGFTDKSWHNDVSPSFIRKLNDTQSIVLWVDYADENRRECGGRQFVVIVTPTEDYFYTEPQDVIETDSWDEAMQAIQKLITGEITCTTQN